ncbi:hypothetical protein L917_10714 [Phytophthora nicotianae]|uniref:RING-type domain-containing protein n=1 Tax=Phytophthora nicotianae TaxID=4792 RepID=W2L225_PHYNI|nr:hypothetical protein L917_10714 [Phytophthora nicotianae]
MKTEPSAPRVLELLAPRFADLGDVSGSLPVSLDLSASMDVQLVFWEREGVTKELECVNVDEGCPRCKFEGFLRGLVILKRRGVLHINGAYAVDPMGRNFARLRLQIEGMHEVAAASKLEEFDFVKCHLDNYNNIGDNVTEEQKIEAARRSKCHVMGCRLHCWQAPRVQVTPERTPRATLSGLNWDQQHSNSDAPSHVPVKREIQVSSPASPHAPQSPMRASSPTPSVVEYAVSLKDEEPVLCEPAPHRKLNLPDVFHSLMARIEAEPSDLWSADVAGLDLKLYEHQRRGLSWMMKRERGILWDTLLLHPFSVPGRDSDTDLELETEFGKTAYDACGGMLCDEPGLGKTITMLALILLTRGHSTSNLAVRVDPPSPNTASVQLRSSSRGRSLIAEDLMSSCTTLVVAPDALVEHWAEQIDMHVVHQGLKYYVDKAEKIQEALPKSKKLAKYDVVIVSFSRMAKEWKLHRPASAMEKRNVLRYGFEDQPDRYVDGSLRGDVSSLLSVHWLRIVVDEGHKLGGRAPTQLMQMSRLLCAERRWVMTGTPSPNTLQSADLQYIQGLLVFLRCQPYGRPDGHAWSKAIARPFQRNEVMGFYRLQHLLNRIMIRHTKESIRDFLPRPIRHTAVVDPSPSEFKLYNAIAENVRASLVTTTIDVTKSSHTPGDIHPDSLLHRKNRQGAGHVESDLAIAFMGGYAVEWAVKKEKMKKSIAKLVDAGVNEARVSTVSKYLESVLHKEKTTCRECGFERRFLMVLPCGHLCCAHCVEDIKKELGEPCCTFCGEEYDEDDFDFLQPTLTGEISTRGRDKTIAKLRAAEVPESRIATVIAYMDSRRAKPPTECISCHQKLHLLLLLPCGHMCCADCTEKRYQVAGPSCCLCHQPYSRQGFKSLQPGVHAEALDDNDQRRKKVSVKKKRKRVGQPTKKTVRLVNVKRDFWKIESSKIFYMTTRIRELMKEFELPSRGRQRELKVIIFSQNRESIWRTKVAFEQQDIPTADFIALINPRRRIENLEAFRSSPNVHVLLLSNLGSHGLDLSFVTQIFLLEEIWDKSVEQQVISRAHRMGATHSVVVEQLWMRGTVECQLASVNQQLFKREASGEDSETRQGQPTREEVQEASSAGKNNFQAMKMSYLLNNLRILPDDVAAKDGEVRYSVLDENEAIIRKGVHTISESGDVTTVSTMPTSPKQRVVAVASSLATPQESTMSTREAAPRVTAKKTKYSPEIIVIDDSSSDEEHKSESDSEDDVRVPLRLHFSRVKQVPEYIEIKDEDTESEC